MRITVHRLGQARTRRLTFAVLCTLALGACATSGNDSDNNSGTPSQGGTSTENAASPEEVDKAMSTPTTLTFWTWVDVEKEVALFEAKYPEIDVKVVNAGQGTPQYTKLRTALKAGSGAPDVAQIEYQYIPTFTVTDDLVDLRAYGAEANADKFVDWTWSQVSGPDGQVYAYPQDTGPMGMLYRQDILDKYGIAAPKTWDEFRDAAYKLHEADPNVYITNIASNDPGAWIGLMWQNGSKPFQMGSPSDISFAINGAESTEVGDYWEKMIKDGVVSTDPDFTDAWYQGLARGKYASWLTAAWGPSFLQGTAEDTAGKWRAAPLPQWDEGTPASGNWGGSTDAVIKGTDNPIAAAKLAEFINTDPESTKILAFDQFLYPATTAILNDPEFIGLTSEFYGGQQVNQVYSDISSTVTVDFQWLPFNDQASSDWNETVGTALADKSDVSDALDEWQSRLTDYAENQGFNVS